jgi:hypothetical protein
LIGNRGRGFNAFFHWSGISLSLRSSDMRVQRFPNEEGDHEAFGPVARRRSDMRRVVTLLLLVQLVMVASTYGDVPLSSTAVGQEVTIEGRLELEGRNYYLDARFVILDDRNDRIPVTIWAPLEVPPSPPSSPPSRSRPRTMQEYIGRRLAVTGIHRTALAGAVPPAIPRLPEGDHYLEVLTVHDVLTGATIFQAQTDQNQLSVAAATNQGTAVSDAPVPAAAAPIPSEVAGASPSAEMTSPPSTPQSGPSPIMAAAVPANSGSPEQAPSSLPAAAPGAAAGPSPVPAQTAPVTSDTSAAPVSAPTGEASATAEEPRPVLSPAAPPPAAPPSSPDSGNPERT